MKEGGCVDAEDERVEVVTMLGRTFKATGLEPERLAQKPTQNFDNSRHGNMTQVRMRCLKS